MLDKTRTQPFSGAILFPTPDAMFEAMFGPPQHDAHIRDRILHLHTVARRKWNDAADARLDAATQKIIARIRSERAR